MKLKINNLTMKFGGVVALHKVYLDLEKGEILGLIGPNGSGKSTLFNVATGFYRATSGSIYMDDLSLGNFYPYKIAQLGIARTFQNLNLFKQMTALENILVGMHRRSSTTLLNIFLRPRRVKKEESKLRDMAEQQLAQLGLSQYKMEKVKNLPYGIQKWGGNC